jgi:hypothetical protein
LAAVHAHVATIGTDFADVLRAPGSGRCNRDFVASVRIHAAVENAPGSDLHNHGIVVVHAWRGLIPGAATNTTGATNTARARVWFRRLTRRGTADVTCA